MITNLANASFNSGRFPAQMKLGQIMPLLKKAGVDAADDSNFRLITNLSTMSKILERLALARLQPHLLRSPNYCTLQSAYRPLHTAETALLKVTDDIYRSVDNGSFTALVSLDVSAAFDALDHSVLSSRLQSDFSINGIALDWIQPYLSGRHSFVQVGRSASCQQPCIAGVSQGSVLGPLLYTVYISLIGHVVGGLGVKHHEYADDTQLYVEMTDRGSLDRILCCISCLQHWFLRSHLLLSGSKSDAIIIGTAQRHARAPQPTHLCVAESCVAVSDTFKLLGVMLNHTMSFNKHVSTIVRACLSLVSSTAHPFTCL